MTNVDDGRRIKIALDSIALKDINAAAGKDFAIGGTVNPVSPIPEPSSVILLGTGILRFAHIIRRKLA